MSEIKQGYKQTKVGIIPEDWNVVKVGEKFDFLKTYSNSREDLNNIDEISYIHYGEIHTKHKFYIDFAKFELPKINKSKLPNEIIFAQNGDLVIADASEDYADIGKSAEIKNLTSKAVSGLHTFLLRDKNNNFVDGYKGYLLYNEIVARSIKKIATGISVLGISKTNLSNLYIPLPPLKEQEKIAEILTTWDEAITKQTELLRAKELQKKALMQKLLSGEVRFSGFSDEWEEVRLGEIGEFKTSSIDKIINENERLVNLINYMDVYRNKHIDKNFRCSKTSLKEEQYEKVNLKKGDILFTPSSETPNDIGHSAVIIEDLPNTGYSYHLVRFRPKKSIDLKFSGYVFNNIDILKEFAKRANGSTRFTLSIKDFNETKAKFPSLPEQQKIAEVLSLADDEINLLKNELEELKLQKKALMQKLLTGQVRVKV